MRQEGPRQRHKCRALNIVALNLPTTQQRMGRGHIKLWANQTNWIKPYFELLIFIREDAVRQDVEFSFKVFIFMNSQDR